MSAQVSKLVSVRFDDARLKVDRAYRHINETEQVLRTFAGSGICKAVIDQDAEAGRCQIRVEVLKQLPAEIALPIGDAIHNLRTALDYVVTRIVGTGNDRITFPMHEERHNLAKSGQFREVVKAFPKLEFILLDEIKPYRTGNYALWALGKVDNIDKHKLLIPQFSITSIIGVSVENRDKSFTMQGLDVHIEAGGISANLLSIKGLPGPFEITSEGQPAISVGFQQGKLLRGIGCRSNVD